MVVMYQKYRYNELKQKAAQVGINFFDIMVTGVTGAGKSTTLNSLCEKNVARVGRGVAPETMRIDCYKLNDVFQLWDTPGLGDCTKNDIDHSKQLYELLYKEYDNKYGFIDMVLVILEGSSKDMGTTYKLLNDIIVPNFQKERILVAVNQADVAMKGRHWDFNRQEPEQPLVEYLEEKIKSIQSRVKESTGVSINKPVYYSAEYGYNIYKLMDMIIDNMPNMRRKLVA